MNKSWILFSRVLKNLFLTLLLTLQTACLLTRHDIKKQESSQQMEAQLKTVQKSTADQGNQMLELDQSLKELSGKIEVLERQQRTQEQAIANKDIQQENQFKIYEQALSKNETEIQQLKTEIESLKLQIKEQKQVSKKTSTKTKVPKGNYRSAEYYFSNKDWKKAIDGYQKYREVNPKGKRYAEATYKIGVCFQELGMVDNAKIFYQEVVEKFPKSKESKKSKYRIKKL